MIYLNYQARFFENVSVVGIRQHLVYDIAPKFPLFNFFQKSPLLIAHG